MAKTKEQKKEILKSLIDKIDQAKSVVFTSFNGLGVKDNEYLRKQLKQENSEYCVVKKTLLDLAFRDKKVDNLKVKDFTGQIAAIFGFGDEVTPAKVVDKFRKDHEDKIDFVGGILDGKYLASDEISALAKLPDKQELYARLVGSINAPVSGLVNALAGNLRNLVYVLSAIKEKKV